MRRIFSVALLFLAAPGMIRALDAQVPVDAQEREWQRTFERSSSLHQYEKHQAAAILAQKAVQLAEQKWGGEDTRVAQSLMLLGCCLEDHGQLEQAEVAYKRALTIAEKVLEPDDTTIIGYAFSLSGIYRRTGREKDAAMLEDRCKTALRQNIAGQKRPAVSPEGRPGGSVAP